MSATALLPGAHPQDGRLDLTRAANPGPVDVTMNGQQSKRGTKSHSLEMPQDYDDDKVKEKTATFVEEVDKNERRKRKMVGTRGIQKN